MKPRRLNNKEEIILTFGVNLCTARGSHKTNSCVADSSFTTGSKLGQRLRLRAKSSREVLTKVSLLMQGREPITGGSPNADEEVNYFRLHVNPYQSLETISITCYTRHVSLNLSSLQLLSNKIDILSLNSRFPFQF